MTFKLKFLIFMTKMTQSIKMKQNQTFFDGTYSNLMAILILSKDIKVF